MGDWVIGALINLLGSIFISFGTSLLRIGHDERKKHYALGNLGTNVRAGMTVYTSKHGELRRRADACSVFIRSCFWCHRIVLGIVRQVSFKHVEIVNVVSGGFWMARLNEGLSRFDAILIVPMFQIAWTFFSICTGFVYFEEYKVFDALRTTMFIIGMVCVFVGIYLLAPDDDESSKGLKDGSLVVSKSQDVERLFLPSDQNSQIKDIEIIWTSYADENANMIGSRRNTIGVGLW
ncbi:hypothetical protein HAX54_029729 [Datura stramonium]|uniref:Probable magnesium transporter n=1 Tax=Datura stramonium TaxID=4076 RepID=A0ABS8RLK7_DATST|nr:hypothetical protein [Datura stramonium]